MRIKGYFFSLVIMSSLVLLQACQQSDDKLDTSSQHIGPVNEQMHIDQTNVSNQNNNQNERLTNEDIANHLATVSSEVPNVHDAIAIIIGPYAVVGIDIDAETERQDVGTIKYSVSEALQHDPYGKTAVVIADADIVQRLRDMKYKMEQGHPIQGMAEELAEIVARYVPTFPTNENRLQEPNVQNEQNLNQHDEQELERIQEEQLND